MEIIPGLLIIVAVLVVTYFLGIFRGAPYLPTDKETLRRMIDAAEIKPGDKVADLGSGDGRIVIAAALAGAEAHGFEINPVLVLWSRYKIKKAGLKGRAFIHWKSFWNESFKDYDVAMLFGITGIMEGLREKLKAELKPGSRIISNTFRFPEWEPIKNQNVFVYRIVEKNQ